jgi:hypothetical protein
MRRVGLPLADWLDYPRVVGRVVRVYYQPLPPLDRMPAGHEVALAWLTMRLPGRPWTWQGIGPVCSCGRREVFGSHQHTGSAHVRTGGFMPGTTPQVELALQHARSWRLEHWYAIDGSRP